MPTYDTPEPISVVVELVVGDIRIVASDRTDTTVEVRPGDAAKKEDVAAAEQTRVEYAAGRLQIKGPKGWRQHTWRGGGESIAVQIGLPAGSHLSGTVGVGSFHCTGRLGECHVKTGVGDIDIDQAGDPVEIKSGAGDITVGRAGGPADVTTGGGGLRIGSIDGTGVIKNSNGDTWIGQISGDLRVNAANGKIVVDQAQSTVTTKTANGDIRLGDVGGGVISAHTAFGKVDIGISDGVTAWLDLHTAFGNVLNDLDPTARPEAGGESVEVRARSSFGDITIRRALTTATTRREDA